MAQSLVKLTLESNQYERNLKNAQRQLNDFTRSIGVNMKSLSGMALAAGAVTGAMKVMKDAFFNSETSLDEWGRTVESTKALYAGFLDALNNSDISGYLERMNSIIDAAREAYDAMDQLNTFNAFNQVQSARGKAGYAQALDEYKLNPTAENKAALAAANKAVMENIKAQQEYTKEAYNAALRNLGTQRGLQGKQLENFINLFKNKSYSELQVAKSSYSTGRLLNSGSQYYYGDRVYDGRVQDRSTGKWRDLTEAETQQFEFARALSQTNDEQIKAVQALGAQVEGLSEAIYQQDRSYNRMAGNNAGKGSGSGSGGGSSRSSRGGRSSVAIMPEDQENNLKIQKLSQEYVQATEERQEAIREEIKTLQERNAVIKQMKDEALGKYKPIEPMGEAEGIMPSFYSKPTQTLQETQFPTKTQLDVLNDELKKLIAFRDQSMTSDEYKNRDFFVKNKQAEIDDYMGRSKKSGTSSKEAIDKLTNKMSTLSSGITSITSGLQAMNVNIPEELQEAINVVNGMISVIQGVSAIISVFSTGAENANTIATVANTTALGALTTAMIANTTVNAIPFFRGGGVAHAAQGFVPGNNHNDNIPIMVSSGELILNRAQQGNIASQLEGNGLQNLHLEAVLRGEDMRLSLKNNGRRTGRGEYVTTNFRRYGTGY